VNAAISFITHVYASLVRLYPRDFRAVFADAVAIPPFYRRDVALLAVPLGLLVAALTYVYARGSDLARIVVLVGIELVNVGIAWAAERVWQDWLLARGQPSPLLPLLVLLTGALLAGPLLGLLGRPLRGVLGRAWG